MDVLFWLIVLYLVIGIIVTSWRARNLATPRKGRFLGNVILWLPRLLKGS